MIERGRTQATTIAPRDSGVKPCDLVRVAVRLDFRDNVTDAHYSDDPFLVVHDFEHVVGV